MIADRERRDHRPRRDLEGLDHERAQEHRDGDGDADRLGVLAQGGLAREREVLLHLLVEASDRAADLVGLLPAQGGLHVGDGRLDVSDHGLRDGRALALQDALGFTDEVPGLVFRALLISFLAPA